MKISILRPGTPEVLGDTGEPAQVAALTLNEARLLRLFLLKMDGALSSEVVAEVVGKKEVHRAVMHVREAMAGCRSIEQPGRTDQSVIRTVRGNPTVYRFELSPDDEVDLHVVSENLTQARIALTGVKLDHVLLTDLSWLDALESTDLDVAFDDVDLHAWTAEDRHGIALLRGQGWAIRARLASLTGRHHNAKTYVQRILEDAEDVFDARVAECAVKAHFVVSATREAGLNALREYFDDRGLTYTSEIDEFAYALNDAEGAGYDAFVATWLDRWDNAPAVPVHGTLRATPPTPTARRAGAGAGEAGVPGILTPGLPMPVLEAELAQRYEPELVQRLIEISASAVTSVEAGDFVAQEAVGRNILELAEADGELASTGQYVVAEGLRLQADLTSGAPRQTLLRLALDAYGASRELAPENIRAIRGSARTYEVLGDPEEAATNYRLAYQLGRQQLATSDQLSPSARLALSHEALRAGRHYVHCLNEILSADPVGARLLGASTDAIVNLARESSALHREKMPLFRSNQDWSRIEWFMGLTLLAKSYAGVGDSKAALGELSNALLARRLMLESGRPLSVVERANLRWWAATAAAVREEHFPGWSSGLGKLQTALTGADDEAVISAVDSLLATLRPILPPQY
ncbi:hypothetical protein ACQE98_16110 [Ornithinimicrobium sp. W1679]